MIKSFRFLLQFTLPNINIGLVLAAFVTAGCVLTGVPNGTYNYFASYYLLFPGMVLMLFFLSSFGICTSNANLAVSFGARRRDFFFGVQLALLFQTVVFWVLQLVMSAIPQVFGWGEFALWDVVMTFGGLAIWVYPLLSIMLFTIGSLCGLLFTRSKRLGFLLLFFFILVGMFMMLSLLLPADIGWNFFNLWGYPQPFYAVGMIAVTAVCQVFMWKTILRYTVR